MRSTLVSTRRMFTPSQYPASIQARASTATTRTTTRRTPLKRKLAISSLGRWARLTSTTGKPLKEYGTLLWMGRSPRGGYPRFWRDSSARGQAAEEGCGRHCQESQRGCDVNGGAKQ